MVGRFARTQYSPGLFDAAQDLAGGLPLQLVEQWLASDQSHDDAIDLLGPHRVAGYNVVSDSAGLTRLTQQRGLMEILAIVHRPKEIVYRLGTALGGRAVGIWSADNTQMFYPESVAAETLVAALLSVQDEVQRQRHVQIGLAAHFGEFYDVADGLYGEASDAVEGFAEHSTGGGEIVISEPLRARLPADHGFTLVERAGAWATLGAVYVVVDGPRLGDLPDRGGHYPIPYSEAFHRDLRALADHLDDAAFIHAITDKYTREKTVVVIEREGELADTPEVALFTNMALSVAMKDTGVRHLAQHHGEEIKIVGGLGIYAFDDPARALAFAEAFRRELSGDGFHCRVGIDLGATLVFALAGGGKDVAGSPVVVAAKLAQDRGLWGKLYLSDRVYERVDVRGFQPITCTVSGEDLHAYEG